LEKLSGLLATCRPARRRNDDERLLQLIHKQPLP
jgi:hypothetical protein